MEQTRLRRTTSSSSEVTISSQCSRSPTQLDGKNKTLTKPCRPTILMRRICAFRLRTQNLVRRSGAGNRSHPRYGVADPDPAWFLDYLETATKWKSKPDSFYSDPYAICTAEAKGAATKFMRKAFNKPPILHPFICPRIPTFPPARDRLSAPLHMIKCHGNHKGRNVLGVPKKSTNGQIGLQPSPARLWNRASNLPQWSPRCAVTAHKSFHLSILRLRSRTRGRWRAPICAKALSVSSGSTMMAWVGLGPNELGRLDCRRLLEERFADASIGRAFLDLRQDYLGYSIIRGASWNARRDEKT